MKREDKILLRYTSKEDLLTNNKILKVYFNMPSASVADLAEKILLEKYDRKNQEMTVRKAICKIRGVHGATIEIPRFNYKEKVSDMISMYVHQKFSKILGDMRNNQKYPTTLRDLVESFDGR